MKKIISLILILILISSALTGCGGETVSAPKASKVKLNLGDLVSEIEGNKNVSELNFESEELMLGSMLKATENEKFELYYSLDNMTVALKEKESGKVVTTNPFNAALDQNYSGNVKNRLDSQVILTYLEEEKSLVEMYSSVDCADLGQYTVKIYDNGLVFSMSIGEEKENTSVPKVLPKKRYEEIYNAIDEFDRELLEMYYVLIKKNELNDSGIYDLYPEMEAKEDLYFCNLELSERENKKVFALFDTAEYTREKIDADAKSLKLGKSGDSSPNFKLDLNYTLTNNGVKVTVPNESISFNADFPLLRITLLPYFGADEASETANGYLFIPDGSGAVINMNQNEPNRRTIITGKVYGENGSTLPKKMAVEKTEQYYLPVFGTVRNNSTAVFGVITNGDANSEITALLGRPNGNYYTVYPEFIYTDYEKYTRVSVVENAWSNKEMYLYDKNFTKEDFSIEYTFLKDEKANYSAMAEIYRNYLFEGKKGKAKKSYINIETLGSVPATDSFLGFEYGTEAVLTSFEDNIEILKYLKENKINNVSLQLNGWQKNGLDTNISNKIRASSKLGGKDSLKKLIEYCNNQKIDISLYNNISFVKVDESFDGFEPKADASRTLELQYAKNSTLSPDTMIYDDGKYVVKASSYNKFLNDLTDSAKDLKIGSLNLSEIGCYLNADYTKDSGINRGEALRYIKETLKNNSKKNLSFEGGNAYVLPFSKYISNISDENSGFIGETASVPFLQMVIGNYLSYNSKPINLKENIRDELLKCIESGTTPTFILSFDNTAALKGTEYTAYFSVDYNILKQDVKDNYKEIEKVFSATDNSAVVSHKILADGVSASTYANGVTVYVNRSQSDFDADGVTVKAMDYTIKE